MHRKLAVLAVPVAAIAMTASACDTGNITNRNSMSNSDVANHIGNLTLGMTEGQVRSVMGNPNNADSSETNGLRDDCWYYGDSWQLCFDNNTSSTGDMTLDNTGLMRLASKNHY